LTLLHKGTPKNLEFSFINRSNIKKIEETKMISDVFKLTFKDSDKLSTISFENVLPIEGIDWNQFDPVINFENLNEGFFLKYKDKNLVFANKQ
jgi:hypothetical protein